MATLVEKWEGIRREGSASFQLMEALIRQYGAADPVYLAEQSIWLFDVSGQSPTPAVRNALVAALETIGDATLASRLIDMLRSAPVVRERGTLLSIGECRFCRQGAVGIRIAELATVVGLCDECEAVYLDKHLRNGPHFEGDAALASLDGGRALWLSPAHWASRAEAEALGWADAIVGEGSAP